MAGLSTLATSQVNGSKSSLLNRDDEKMFPCKTNRGKNPLSLWEFIPKTYRHFPNDESLQPLLRLEYENAALVGYKGDITNLQPEKVTPCAGYNLCIDVDKRHNYQHGRVVPVNFLENIARVQLGKKLKLKPDSISFRGDLSRKKLSMKLGWDVGSDDFAELIKAQIRVYRHMIIMEF